jgi:hypothetical protein
MPPTRSEELAMMSEPDRWPQWPLLPIKLLGHAFEEEGTGLLFADKQPIIYLINLWAVKDQEQLRNAKQLKFTSFESILDAGWVVD